MPIRLWRRDDKGNLTNVGQASGIVIPQGPDDYGDGIVRVAVEPRVETGPVSLSNVPTAAVTNVMTIRREPLMSPGFHGPFRVGTLYVMEGPEPDGLWDCPGMQRYRRPFSFEEIHNG